MPDSRVMLGTSGWSYKEWVGPFYTRQDKSLLKAYTKVFETAEIDSTFYRFPSRGTVMGWARYSPEGFVFTAKLPRVITHEKKLGIVSDVSKDLEAFVDLMEPLWLNGKLGCLLVQLPPSFDYKPDVLERFFRLLPSQIRFAVEFRNLSWIREETWPLLRKYRVAYTVVDEPLLPPTVKITSDIAYFRWHGRGERPWFDYRYKTDELAPWIPRLKDAVKNSRNVYGYFNNHFHGYAVENCLQIMEMLGAISPNQCLAKGKIGDYFRTMGKKGETKLDAFTKPVDGGLEKQLLLLTDTNRFTRAKEIREDELNIGKQTPFLIEARLRDYHIVIDMQERVIRHDCEDWMKGISSQRLCKHMIKLFLSMDKQTATDLLNEIAADKANWKFEKWQPS